MTILVVFLTIALLLLGAPLYIAVLAMGGYFFYAQDIPLVSTVISFQKLETQSFLSAIPLFTFAGYVLSQSKASMRLVNFSKNIFPDIPGTTSLVVVLIMAIFTSLTGASGVSILALGGLIYPLVKETTDDDNFSYGIITASGSIGLLFAPALPAIIYAIIANQNSSFSRIDINTLFFVALVPSFLLIGFFSIYSIFKERALAKKTSQTKKKEKRAILKSIYEAAWEIPLPFLVYGGIYLGWVSVLEASILTALYCFIITFIIRKDLSLKDDFVKVTCNSLKLSGGIFIIMVSAFILTNYIVNERIPDKLFSFLSIYINDKYSFLLLINVFLLITGCLLDIFSAILIILPLIIPLVEKYGIDPYHFAIIFLVNLEIGYLTPPVGLNLFIASFRFKKNIIYLYKAIFPFFLMMLATLIVLTYIPKLSTFLLSEEEVAKNISIAPPRPENVKIEKTDQTSLDISFTLPAKEIDSPNFDEIVLYYLDEDSDDLEFIKDLGFSKKYPINSLTKNENSLIVTLDELSPDTQYTIIAIFYSKGVEGVSSKIIKEKTLP